MAYPEITSSKSRRRGCSNCFTGSGAFRMARSTPPLLPTSSWHGWPPVPQTGDLCDAPHEDTDPTSSVSSFAPGRYPLRRRQGSSAICLQRRCIGCSGLWARIRTSFRRTACQRGLLIWQLLAWPPMPWRGRIATAYLGRPLPTRCTIWRRLTLCCRVPLLHEEGRQHGRPSVATLARSSTCWTMRWRALTPIGQRLASEAFWLHALPIWLSLGSLELPLTKSTSWRGKRSVTFGLSTAPLTRHAVVEGLGCDNFCGFNVYRRCYTSCAICHDCPGLGSKGLISSRLEITSCFSPFRGAPFNSKFRVLSV